MAAPALSGARDAAHRADAATAPCRPTAPGAFDRPQPADGLASRACAWGPAYSPAQARRSVHLHKFGAVGFPGSVDDTRRSVRSPSEGFQRPQSPAINDVCLTIYAVSAQPHGGSVYGRIIRPRPGQGPQISCQLPASRVKMAILTLVLSLTSPGHHVEWIEGGRPPCAAHTLTRSGPLAQGCWTTAWTL